MITTIEVLTIEEAKPIALDNSTLALRLTVDITESQVVETARTMLNLIRCSSLDALLAEMGLCRREIVELKPWNS